MHFTCKVPRWCPKTPISSKGEQYFSFCSQQTCFTDKSSLATWFQLLLQNLPITLWEIHIEKKSICMSRRDLSGWFCSSNIFHSSFVHRKYIKQIKWHIKVHRGTHFIIGLFLWHLANHSKGAQPTFCNMFLLETCLSQPSPRSPHGPCLLLSRKLPILSLSLISCVKQMMKKRTIAKVARQQNVKGLQL